MNFTGYKLIDERTNSEMSREGGGQAHYENNLHAFSLRCPDGDETVDGIGALEHLIRVGAMFVIPADRFDASTYSKVNDRVIYYYENYAGGIGVAKKLLEKWTDALRKGMEVAQDCGCKKGCQNCIEPAKSFDLGSADIDKNAGINLANKILMAEKKGPVRKFHNGRMVPIQF